jgi:hypothetical protein
MFFHSGYYLYFYGGGTPLLPSEEKLEFKFTQK